MESGTDKLLFSDELFGNLVLTTLFVGSGGRGNELLQLDVVEEDDEQAVAAGNLQEEWQLALQGDQPHEVSKEYQQGVLADVPADTHRESREVGLLEVGLLGVERFHEFVYMAGTAVGSHEGLQVIVEGDESGTVLLAHGDVAESQGGVDGIVEKGHALKGLLHDAALVDNAKHLLRPLVLIDVHHRTAETRGGPPVHGAVIVAAQVVANMFELGVMADAAYALDARLLQVLADGHQLVLV